LQWAAVGPARPGFAAARRAIVNNRLSHIRNTTVMRFAMAVIFAVLIFNFADEHFNSARYTLAAMNAISNITRSFG
jgi:hypothetical protein